MAGEGKTATENESTEDSILTYLMKTRPFEMGKTACGWCFAMFPFFCSHVLTNGKL